MGDSIQGAAAEAVRRAEEELRRARAFTRRLVEAMPGGVVEVGMDGAIRRANAEAQRILGFSFDELTQRHVVDFQTETIFEDGSPCPVSDYPVARCLGTGQPQPAVTIGVRRQSGEVAWAVFSAVPLTDPDTGQQTGAIATFLDITERKHVEERLRVSVKEREMVVAEKMDALGLLSGGIAHDFNNLLTIIQGRLSIALLQVGSQGDVHGTLVEAANAAKQAQDLTQQFLTFARGGSPVKQVSSLAALIRATAALSLSGTNVTSALSVAPDLWPAEVDPGQIGRALNNLVLNAVAAMPEGGTVHLQAENAELGAANDVALSAGRYVRLTVRDEGVGIPAEHLARIFDPYFTTKPAGSGLGLAVTYSIIAKHGGCIRVESALGRGAAFHIYLPASERALPAASPTAAPPFEHEGRILVMDDDPEVRCVLSDMLRLLGYEVESAVEGEAAIRMCEEARRGGRPYAVVILDLTVRGGLGGKETLRRLRDLAPDLTAIVSSGYSTDPVMSDHASEGFAAVLPKPYDLTQLGAVLSRVLGRAPSAAP